MKTHTKFHRLHCILHFSLEVLTLAAAVATLVEIEKAIAEHKADHKNHKLHLL